jgi:hypothetical protein
MDFGKELQFRKQRRIQGNSFNATGASAGNTMPLGDVPKKEFTV